MAAPWSPGWEGDLEPLPVIAELDDEVEADEAPPSGPSLLPDIVKTLLLAVVAVAVVLIALSQVRIAEAARRSDCQQRARDFRPGPDGLANDDMVARVQEACRG